MAQTVPKSCATCPSFLTPSESTEFFKKSIGVPVCARYGKPLARIGGSETDAKAIQKKIASNCDSHGVARPTIPDYSRVSMQVMLPNPVALSEEKRSPELIKGCGSCTFFVRDVDVIRGAGFAAGLCAAKGKLLLSPRLTLEARNCQEKSVGNGSPGDWISGMTFLPEYEYGFKGEDAPERVYAKNSKHLVDPTAYESDKDVTDADKAHGIRAWRKLEDFMTGNSVFLPIYNSDFFPEDQRRHIPRSGDDEHPEDYIDHMQAAYKCAVLWTELDETPALWGQPGTGKTELFRHMAWLMGLPFYRFSITASTEIDDLAGKMHFENGETVFKYGRLPNAWKSPGVICIDEPNTGPPEVWQLLRPLTDNSKQLVLDMNEGESIDRNADAYLGMAMNPAWDFRNVGTNQIGDADANRMMHLFIEAPPAELERKIITDRCAHDGFEIDKETLDMVMAVALDIRGLCDDGALTMSWMIRPQLKVARLMRWFDPLTAYRMASADYLEPAQQEILLDAVRAHVG